MINITRDGERVKLAFTVPIPLRDTRIFSFTFNCADENYAGLLASQMRKQVFDMMRSVREDAYTQGWSDAKSKRTRETWFEGTL